jgi:hypothetical protein
LKLKQDQTTILPSIFYYYHYLKSQKHHLGANPPRYLKLKQDQTTILPSYNLFVVRLRTSTRTRMNRNYNGQYIVYPMRVSKH